MSLLDIDVNSYDVLLHNIRNHYQKMFSKTIKILSVEQWSREQINIGVTRINWDEIFDDPTRWYVYYKTSIKTNWDLELFITYRKHEGRSGGRTVKEFIEGNIKPRYLL